MATRRAVINGMLGCAGAAPVLWLGLSSGVRAMPAPGCFDPQKLPASARSLRQALGFATPAPDPARTCRGCVFFSASAKADPGDCGTCGLLGGGPVTAKSWCRSWAKKA